MTFLRTCLSSVGIPSRCIAYTEYSNPPGLEPCARDAAALFVASNVLVAVCSEHLNAVPASFRPLTEDEELVLEVLSS